MKNKIKSGLSELTRRLKSITAEDIMTRGVITTTKDVTLAKVAKEMIKARISGLPIVDKKKKIIGVITDTDLFIVMDMIKSGDIVENKKQAISNPTVKFAMSTYFSKIKKNTTLDEIIAIMKYKDVHTLPVVEKGKLVGVIGRRDVFKDFYAAVRDL